MNSTFFFNYAMLHKQIPFDLLPIKHLKYNCTKHIEQVTSWHCNGGLAPNAMTNETNLTEKHWQYYIMGLNSGHCLINLAIRFQVHFWRALQSHCPVQYSSEKDKHYFFVKKLWRSFFYLLATNLASIMTTDESHQGHWKRGEGTWRSSI